MNACSDSNEANENVSTSFVFGYGWRCARWRTMRFRTDCGACANIRGEGGLCITFFLYMLYIVGIHTTQDIVWRRMARNEQLSFAQWRLFVSVASRTSNNVMKNCFGHSLTLPHSLSVWITGVRWNYKRDEFIIFLLLARVGTRLLTSGFVGHEK